MFPRSSRPTDIRIVEFATHLIPVQMRVPLKFGSESIDRVTCLRVRAVVESRNGQRATGWGETPLSVTWAWPSQELSYAHRYDAMVGFADHFAKSVFPCDHFDHPLGFGIRWNDHELPRHREEKQIPELAALVTASAFDIALHDAFAQCVGADIYDLYSDDYVGIDLGDVLTPAAGSDVSFRGKSVVDFLSSTRKTILPVWHLVGGLDPIFPHEVPDDAPQDDYPVSLVDWIDRDGLTELKIKLRGNDMAWDYDRIVEIGQLSLQKNVKALSTDFNCTVLDPDYVNEILDRLQKDHPKIWDLILYVEQPFPADLDAHPIDVHSVAMRKPLFLDESAHDWRFVSKGRSLGWNGVALKTCKTQTGALLSHCWAKAHGMPRMVQDLTNPMLAQIPHVRLASVVDTIAGVESNGMQFYPAASDPEAVIHPGLFRRRDGQLDLSTLDGNGFGYRIDEIQRDLPEPTVYS